MSAIISIYGSSRGARLASGLVVCCDGGSMAHWPHGPILCAEGTANAVNDGWWRKTPSLYLAAVNGNHGKCGIGSRMSFGATIHRDGP